MTSVLSSMRLANFLLVTHRIGCIKLEWRAGIYVKVIVQNVVRFIAGFLCYIFRCGWALPAAAFLFLQSTQQLTFHYKTFLQERREIQDSHRLHAQHIYYVTIYVILKNMTDYTSVLEHEHKYSLKSFWAMNTLLYKLVSHIYKLHIAQYYTIQDDINDKIYWRIHLEVVA